MTFPCEAEWRLYIATPQADSEGPLKVLALIRSILDRMPESEREGMTLRDVSVVGPERRMVKETKRADGVVHAERGKVARRTSIMPGERFIYRLSGSESS